MRTLPAAAVGALVARFVVLPLKGAPSLNVLLVTFNTKKPPFNDPRVRRALGHRLARLERRLAAAR